MSIGTGVSLMMQVLKKTVVQYTLMADGLTFTVDDYVDISVKITELNLLVSSILKQ